MPTRCVAGDIATCDNAELNANLKETDWETQAAMCAISLAEKLTSHVMNLCSNIACDNIADLGTSCAWRLNPDGVYTARAGNMMRSTTTQHQHCAN